MDNDKLLGSLVVVLGGVLMLALIASLLPTQFAEPAEIEVAAIQIEETIKCKFDKPITVVISVIHYYDDYDELNLDYLTMIEDNEDLIGDGKEVWGWSDCEHQPDVNYAACDIYAVYPELVRDLAAFHTIGHEVFHGSCGSFHE